MTETLTQKMPQLLCIDDSRSQLALFKSQLSGNYRVVVAGNYEESIAQLSSEIPDLILLDMNMPGIDGLEFVITSYSIHYTKLYDRIRYGYW